MPYLNEKDKINLVRTIMDSINSQDAIETIRVIVSDKKYDDEGP